MTAKKARRAYAQASRVIQHAAKSELVANKLVEYGWPAETLSTIGIGTVESYDWYFDQMTKTYGHEREFLAKIDLLRQDAQGKFYPHPMFQPYCLIYTIRDEFGSPIGFSARNLNYEAELKASEGKDWKPKKYVNTAKTILFDKSQVLFNFDQARKSSLKSIQVFEGNADCTTMYAGGVRTAVALCGTAFTEKHLEMVLGAGIGKITLIMDPDAAGLKATNRFVDTLEQFGGHPGLTVEMIVMPEGTGDPDAYVRAFGPNLKVGVSEFRKLTRTDLFTWKLRKQIEEGADPIEIAKSTMGLIVNLPSNLDRLKQVEQLAAATGLPSEFLQREMWRLVDTNESQAEEQKSLVVNETIKQLQRNPGSAESIFATAHMRLEEVENSRNGFDPKTIREMYRTCIEKMEAATTTDELITGNPIFDSLMGGFPKEGVNISVPGGPHHGKSIKIDNWIIEILGHNPDAQIMLHHVDDAAMLRIPRLLGIMSGLSSRMISKAGASYLGPGGDEFQERFRKADDQLSKWIDEERLILADVSILSGTLPAHERWIKEIRRRSPKRHFMSIGDNFHLFDMPGVEDGKAKVRAMSKYVASMATRHGVTTLFAMELPKESLKPGIRPKYTDSKGTGGIAFDSKVNIGIYQELQSLGDDAVLTWNHPDFMEEVIDPNGYSNMRFTPLPIVEVIVDKNKVTGEKKTIFYRLEPLSGKMEECSLMEQQELAQRLANVRNESKKTKSLPHAGHIKLDNSKGYKWIDIMYTCQVRSGT